MQFVLNLSTQIKNQLKRKAYEDAGLQPPTAAAVVKAAAQAKLVTKVVGEPQAKKHKPSGNFVCKSLTGLCFSIGSHLHYLLVFKVSFNLFNPTNLALYIGLEFQRVL